MNKRGTTLIETAISIFIVAVVVVSFLEALNVGLTGTLSIDRKTSALNLAKSELEMIKAKPYIPSTGNLSSVLYGFIDSNTSDKLNYNISGRVAYVNNQSSLQQITVNVTYLNGKQEQLIGYKVADSDLSSPPAKGKIVTDVIKDMPFLPTGGFWLWGQWCGYYHTFNTTASATISATWKFHWTRDVPNLASAGSPWILIYGPDPAYPGENRAPQWVQRDYQGNVYPDGFICRGGSFWCAGCPPAPAGTCNYTWPGDYAPVAQLPPYDCVSYAGWDLLTCTIGCSPNLFRDNYNWCMYGSVSWYDDNTCDGSAMGSRTDKDFEFTVSTPSAVDPGQYTVLFFNGETTISFETISASVTYVY